MENINLTEKVKSILDDHQIILNKHVPYKVLQCNYKERQDVYGLERKFSVYCVSNNNSMAVMSKMRNDFFERSDIFLVLSKTLPQTSTVNEYTFKLLDGDNELVKNSFDDLKKIFYDNYINYKVFPQK